MKNLLLATSVMAGLACVGALPAQAQSADDAPVGKAAGTFMVRGRIVGVIPQNSSSSISGAINGGSVSTSNFATPEVDLSYFFTDHIATELIAATSKHDLYANNTPLGSSYRVGSTWVLPPTLLLQYHFMPHERFSPYIGVGVNASIFYATQAANNAVTSLSMKSNFGVAAQVGFDYNFSGRWFANVDFKQIWVNTQASINGGAIVAKTALNPSVVGVGLGYRF